MGFINILVVKDVLSEISDIQNELPNQFKTIVTDGLKEDYSFHISVYTPIRDGDLVGGHVVTDEGDYGFFFDNEMYYYPYIILGTKAHWIGSPVLIEGSWVYIGMHPGTAPNDYMLMAFDAGELDVDSRLEDMGNWIIGD